MSLFLVLSYVFPLLMVWCAVSDVLTMTISNRVSLLIAATFLVIAPFVGFGWETIAWSFGLGVVVLLITYILFALRLIGGGDAKMCAATALWMGPTLMMEYAFYSAIFGGFLTLVILIIKKAPALPFVGDTAWYARLADSKTGVPYGVALALGALYVYPQTPIFLALTGI